MYLGSVVNRQGDIDRDVTATIGRAWVASVMLNNIWDSKKIIISIKLCIFNANIKVVLLYSSEHLEKDQLEGDSEDGYAY